MREPLYERVGEMACILHFLEETAGNFGTHLDHEYGYSVGGWCGLQVLLAHVRERLEAVSHRLEEADM